MPKHPPRPQRGRPVELAVAGMTPDSPWNVLAYAVALKGRGASLTADTFAEIVANFQRFGREVPVVLYHADLDAEAHPDSRKAHAWVTDLRVGSMKDSADASKTIATLEGRFRWVVEATRADVEAKALRFGSITVFPNATDEESGEKIGAYLYSFSLTNNPALTRLPELAASRRAESRIEAGYWYGDIDSRCDVVEMLRCIFGLPALCPEADAVTALDRFAAMLDAPDEAAGIDLDDLGASLRQAMRLPVLTSASEVIAAIRAALTTPVTTPEPAAMPMGDTRGKTAMELLRMSNKYLTLAAQLGVAAASEEDAEKNVMTLAREAVETRRALGLTALTTPTELSARLATLSTDAAALASVRTELDALKAVELARATVERKAHVDALILAQPALEPARVALEAFAAQDYTAFAAKYPRPAVDPRVTALTSRVAPSGGATPSPVVSLSSRRHNDKADDRAQELMQKTPGLSYEEALKTASRELRNAVKGA